MTDDGGARAMCADDIWIVVLRTEHYCYGWKGRDPGGGGAVNAPRYGVPAAVHASIFSRQRGEVDGARPSCSVRSTCAYYYLPRNS